MLLELRIRDLSLIDAADLEFAPGFTVLTGETGAGKTALLNSLKLLVGERGDSTVVRGGAAETRVEALFATKGEKEGQGADREYLAARRLSADGRSRCYLNDSLVTVKTLASEIGPLVDLYGQHEHQSLLSSAKQLEFLDAYAGPPLVRALQAYQQAFVTHASAADELQALLAALDSSALQRQQAEFLLQEINKVNPLPGEYEELQASLPILQNGEELAAGAQAALEYLRGEGQAEDELAQASALLQELAALDPSLDGLSRQLEGLQIAVGELASDLRGYRDRIEFNAEALEQSQSRMGQLEGLIRRFGPLAEVLRLRQEAEFLLVSSEDSEQRRAAAEENLRQRQEKLAAAAALLASIRQRAGREFSGALARAVSKLAMPQAAFEFKAVDLKPQAWTLRGSQSLELLYRPEPVARFAPLAKIASGGELSRVMLAIRSLQPGCDQAMTLVFDEIDAGIGGETANAIASHLRELAISNQVVVITHLAQIAAVADDQLVVARDNSAAASKTTVTRVQGQDRVRELARMLSGSQDEAALLHARQLLSASHPSLLVSPDLPVCESLSPESSEPGASDRASRKSPQPTSPKSADSSPIPDDSKSPKTPSPGAPISNRKSRKSPQSPSPLSTDPVSIPTSLELPQDPPSDTPTQRPAKGRP